MFKYALMFIVIISATADEITDILTCDFRSWCQLIPDTKWRIKQQNATFYYAMFDGNDTTASIGTPAFDNKQLICFKFKYQLVANTTHYPVSLTVSDNGGTLFNY